MMILWLSGLRFWTALSAFWWPLMVSSRRESGAVYAHSAQVPRASGLWQRVRGCVPRDHVWHPQIFARARGSHDRFLHISARAGGFFLGILTSVRGAGGIFLSILTVGGVLVALVSGTLTSWRVLLVPRCDIFGALFATAFLDSLCLSWARVWRRRRPMVCTRPGCVSRVLALYD